jgi:hypothetical protein
LFAAESYYAVPRFQVSDIRNAFVCDMQLAQTLVVSGLEVIAGASAHVRNQFVSAGIAAEMNFIRLEPKDRSGPRMASILVANHLHLINDSHVVALDRAKHFYCHRLMSGVKLNLLLLPREQVAHFAPAVQSLCDFRGQ